MGFETFGNQGGGDSGGSEVDWNALNEHMLKAFGSDDARNIVGVISSIVSLGIQKQDDAMMDWSGTAEDETQEIEKNPASYFETDSDGKRYKRWPVKDCASVAITVDFPQIQVDKGQFFGESKPLPLRMLLNGEWRFNKEDGSGKELRVNRQYILKETTKDLGVWTIPTKNVLYKMAKAAGLLNEDKSFKPNNLDKLLGVALQFEVEVSPYRTGDKTYVNEKIKFLGAPAEGVALQTLDESLMSMVQFTQENTPESLEHLRASVKNTIRLATNYGGSVLQGQLGSAGNSAPKATGEEDSSAPIDEKPPTAEPQGTGIPDVDFDADVPF